MQSYKTPKSTMTWATLEQWHACAWELEKRRASSRKHELIRAHLWALRLVVIYGCTNRDTLMTCRFLLRHGPGHLGQPVRGHRQRAPQTPLIVAISNRLAQLDRFDDVASIPDGHNSRKRSKDRSFSV